MEIRIGEGYCYQVINHLPEVTSKRTASVLMRLSERRCTRIISQEEALDQGYDELVGCAIPSKNDMYVIVAGTGAWVYKE